MKKFFLALMVAGITSLSVNAQEVTLEGISGRSFSGVRTINGQIYYTFYFGEKSETKGMANFVLALYDQDLKSIKNTNIEISKNSELAASAFNGKYFMFIFADVTKNKRTTVTLDKEGNIVKQKVDEDVKAALLMPDNYPVIHGLNEDEFIVLHPEKVKKYGFEVERMDKDLNSKWTKPYFPEHGTWSIQDSRIVNGKLFILREEKETLLGEKYTYTVQGMNVDNGDQLFATELKNNDDGGFPNFINPTEDGGVITGGMYFKNGKYDDKNSDGLFFAIIAPDGNISKFSKTSWKKVQDQIKGDFSSALFGGKTKVMVEDIIHKKDGNYMIVTETWRKSNDAENTGDGGLRKLGKLGGFGGGGSSSSSDPHDKGFTVMDFAFFNFDANGELASIDKVDKITKEAVIKGKLADRSGLSMALELYNRRFFCYRNCIEMNGKQYIVFKNDDGYKSKAYFMPVGATSTQGLPFIDMDKWVPEGLNKMGQITKWTGGNKYTIGDEEFGQSTNPELYKGIVPAKEGYMLMYQFFNGKMSMWLQPVPAS